MDELVSRVRAWWTTHRTGLEPASVLWLWWCVGLLAHYDDREHWHISPLVSASVAACVLGMFCTRSPSLMLTVAALQAAVLWQQLPSIDNHWTFAAFVDVVFVGATLTWVIRRWIGKQSIGALDDDWYRIAAPIVRLLVLALYGFAVFHKLNTGFLEPQTSCAVHMYHRVTQTPLVPLHPGALSDSHGDLVVAGVLALEAAIPVLLLGRRTWFLGIVAGVVFHLCTGMFMRHFPSIMLATYWVFVPVDVQRLWLAIVERWIRRATRNRCGYIGIAVAVTLALSIGSMLVREVQLGKLAPWLLMRGWNAYVVLGGIVAFAAFVRIGGAEAHPRGRFSTRAWWLYAIVVVFVVNGFSPYLGLKTMTSINMWSNLVVTGPRSNHLLVPAGALRVFDYTSDVVTVHKSSDEKLKALATTKKQVSWLMFRHAVQRAVRAAKKKDLEVSVTYVRDGVKVVVPDAANDPVLMDRGSYLERKIVSVKSTFGTNPERCSL